MDEDGNDLSVLDSIYCIEISTTSVFFILL